MREDHKSFLLPERIDLVINGNLHLTFQDENHLKTLVQMGWKIIQL